MHSEDTTLFEEDQISPTVTEDKVLQFFQEHGIFYESDKEIGILATTLGEKGLDHHHGIDEFKRIYMRKPVSRSHLRLSIAYNS